LVTTTGVFAKNGASPTTGQAVFVDLRVRDDPQRSR
jgi:hypothetical protein